MFPHFPAPLWTVILLDQTMTLGDLVPSQAILRNEATFLGRYFS